MQAVGPAAMVVVVRGVVAAESDVDGPAPMTSRILWTGSKRCVCVCACALLLTFLKNIVKAKLGIVFDHDVDLSLDKVSE